MKMKSYIESAAVNHLFSRGTSDCEFDSIVVKALGLNEKAREWLDSFLRRSISRGQSARICFIGYSVACPSDEPERRRGFEIGQRGWVREGNFWVLELALRAGDSKINIAVVMRVAGDPDRVILMEVDDYLNNRSRRVTQAQVRRLVKDRLFETARHLSFSGSRKT